MPDINQSLPITFPTNFSDALFIAGEHGIMSPSFLSSLIMYAVLPAKLSMCVEKTSPLENGDDGFCSEQSWCNRSFFAENPNYFASALYKPMSRTHAFKTLTPHGIETLDAMQRHGEPNQQHYEIFCCGNGQDAMNVYSVAVRISKQPNKNYIFWNYPGVGCSAGDSHSVHDLFKAGYQQAKRLLDQGIPAQNITIHGLSLGGGVAAHVTRQLHEEGYLVHLDVDRSFSQLSAVIPASINTNTPTAYAPLITSVIAFSLSGVALGTTFAGFIATIGLGTACATETMGYIGAYWNKVVVVLKVR